MDVISCSRHIVGANTMIDSMNVCSRYFYPEQKLYYWTVGQRNNRLFIICWDKLQKELALLKHLPKSQLNHKNNQDVEYSESITWRYWCCGLVKCNQNKGGHSHWYILLHNYYTTSQSYWRLANVQTSMKQRNFFGNEIRGNLISFFWHSVGHFSTTRYVIGWLITT